MKLKELVPGLFVLALLAGLAFLWLSPSGLKTVPTLSATTLDGRKIDFAHNNKPYLVTFWATTCPGCVAEMPHLIELYNDYKSRGFDVIAIAMSYDPPDQVAAMRKAKQIPYPIVLDLNGQLAKAFDDVRLTPTSFLIAPDGRIVQQTLGEMNMEDLRKRINALL